MTPEKMERRLRRLCVAGAVALGLALLVGALYVTAHGNQDLVLLLRLGQH